MRGRGEPNNPDEEIDSFLLIILMRTKPAQEGNLMFCRHLKPTAEPIHLGHYFNLDRRGVGGGGGGAGNARGTERE